MLRWAFYLALNTSRFVETWRKTVASRPSLNFTVSVCVSDLVSNMLVTSEIRCLRLWDVRWVCDVKWGRTVRLACVPREEGGTWGHYWSQAATCGLSWALELRSWTRQTIIHNMAQTFRPWHGHLDRGTLGCIYSWVWVCLQTYWFEVCVVMFSLAGGSIISETGFIFY